MNEIIIFTPLEKALASLERAAQQDKNEFTRDATIQRFEYCYKLSWKILKRYLKNEIGIEENSIKNLYRHAGKIGLVTTPGNVSNWFKYHTARNLTSHTYNEITADETYEIAKLFLNDAKDLLSAIKERYKP